MGQGQSQNSASSGLTLKTLAASLANGDFKNVIVMCGAGISTSAGVPDFRSPSFGLYNQIRKVQDLPYPEAIFEGAFFQRNPVPFYTLVRSIFPQRLCPTDTHKFFALLHQKGIIMNNFCILSQVFDRGHFQMHRDFTKSVHPEY